MTPSYTDTFWSNNQRLLKEAKKGFYTKTGFRRHGTHCPLVWIEDQNLIVLRVRSQSPPKGGPTWLSQSSDMQVIKRERFLKQDKCSIGGHHAAFMCTSCWLGGVNVPALRRSRLSTMA
jgi:hypothetical protein